MAPASVLLDRTVRFVRAGASARIQSRGQDEEIRLLAVVEPDLDIVDIPGRSSMSVARRAGSQRVPCGIICSTDRALVLLYAGVPAFSCDGDGYLVYDASRNAIDMIPELELDSDSDHGRCSRAAILSCGGHRSYVVAELVPCGDDAAAALYLMWSSERGRWVRKGTDEEEAQCDTNVDIPRGRWYRSEAQLPHGLFTPTFPFKTDMAFSYADNSVCWVDLLKGVLVCDLLESPSAPKFTFVPLPDGCSIDFPTEGAREGFPIGRPRPQEFRTMGCVDGVIKFVTLDGFYENRKQSDIVLKTWRLSRDLKEWEPGNPLGVTNIWASESFRERNLPQLTPTFPIISMDDAQVIYVTLNDIEYEKRVNSYGEIRRGNMVHKAQCRLCLNTEQNKVVSSIKVVPENLKPHFPDLLVSEFSAYLQEGWLIRASNVGASRKRKNF